MKIELNEQEMMYLRSAPFWDWKRAEIDADMAEINNYRLYDKEYYVEQIKFYKNIYLKLGGEE